MISSIQSGTEVLVNQALLTIQEVDMTNEHITLQDKATRRTWSKSFGEFSRDFEKKELRFVTKNNPIADDESSTKRRLSRYAPKLVDEAYVRLGWVLASIDENGRWNKNSVERYERQKRYALSIGPDTPLMSDRHIKRLIVRWKFNNKSIEALIPRISARGNRKRRLTDDQARLIDAKIEDVYLQENRPSISALHRVINESIVAEPQYQHLDFISRSTVEREVKKISSYERCKRRHGWFEAQRRYPHGSPVQRARYLMQRVEIDHTPIDLEVLCPDTGENIGRVWLTTVFETKSKMVTGYYLAAHAPTSRSVIMAVISSILSKDSILNSNPDLIGHVWPCMGLMAEISMDNGADLLAKATQHSLASLDVMVHLNPKARPNYKGGVERVQRTANEQVTEHLPGRTFSNYIEKGDYNAKKNAVMTLNHLRRVFEVWLITIYHMTVHSTIKATPLEEWRRLEMELPALRMPPSMEELEKLLWQRHERTVQKAGINMNSITYQSVELQDIARQFGHGVKVDVFTDPSNVSIIRVRIPGTEDFIDAHAERNDYIDLELSYEEHQEVIAHARQRNVDGRGRMPAAGDLSPSQLLASWSDILRIRDEARDSRKKATRTKEAKRASREKAKDKRQTYDEGFLTNNHDETPLPANTEDL